MLAEYDIAQLRKLVMRSMAGPGSKFVFLGSGNYTAATNLGQICLIGFELFEMTRDELDSDDEGASGDDEWLTFCKTTLYRTTRRWERRLEDTDSDEDNDSSKTIEVENSDEREDSDEFENNFDRLLDSGAQMSRLGRSHVAISRPDSVTEDLNLAAEQSKPKSKDDTQTLTEDEEFAQNNYWRLPEPAFDDLVLD